MVGCYVHVIIDDLAAGNLAEEHRNAAALGCGAEPWAELDGYRNVLAHAFLGTVLPSLLNRGTSCRKCPKEIDKIRADLRIP